MFYHCQTYYRKILNPIIDWTTDEVWEFIREYKIPYCCLYDEGYQRLGCIGCPMAARKERIEEFKRYPKYKENYIRAFDRMIKGFTMRKGWKTGEEVFEWWLSDGKNPGIEQERIEENE